ncbi:MAG: M16 family metallopeptidase [Pyrinomonadaceae bacterium]
MKKFFLGSVLILSLWPTAFFGQSSSTATAPPVYKIPFVSKTLENGLEVIVYPDTAVPLVTIELAVRNGSFTEPPELNGLSHLYEHMFFKPNKAVGIYRCNLARKNGRMDYFAGANCSEQLKLSAQIGDLSYIDDLDNAGSMQNATTREEVVNYFFTVLKPHVATAIKSMSDSVRFPNFDEEEFVSEKKVVIGEVDRNESNPFFYLNNTLNEKMYFKYPTRKMPLGTRESIEAATTAKMRIIQERYYVPNNSAIVVTGDVDPAEIFKLVEKDFGDWKRRPVDPFKEFPLVEHPPIAKSEGFIVEQPVQNVLISIGWHGPSIGKDNAATYAADVFSYILSQPDSRFQRNLVDSGLTVGANIGYYTQRNVGPISILLVTTPDKAKAALKAAYAEVVKFDDPAYFSDAELKNARTILESRDLFEREKLTEYAHILSFWWSSTGIDYFRGYHQAMRSVTRADTNRYVQTYIQGKSHIAVAMLSPASKSESGITTDDLIDK